MTLLFFAIILDHGHDLVHGFVRVQGGDFHRFEVGGERDDIRFNCPVDWLARSKRDKGVRDRRVGSLPWSVESPRHPAYWLSGLVPFPLYWP